MSCVRGLFSRKGHRHSTSSETILAGDSTGAPGSSNGGSEAAASKTQQVETDSNCSDGNVGRNSRVKTKALRGSAGHQEAAKGAPGSRSAGRNDGSLSHAATLSLRNGGVSTPTFASSGAGSVSSKGRSSTLFSKGTRAASVAYRTLRGGASAGASQETLDVCVVEKSSIVSLSSEVQVDGKKPRGPASSTPPFKRSLAIENPARPLTLPPVVAKSQGKRETRVIKSAGKENANSSDQRQQKSNQKLTTQATIPLTPAIANIIGKGGAEVSEEVVPSAKDFAGASGSSDWQEKEAAQAEASSRHRSPGPDLPGLPTWGGMPVNSSSKHSQSTVSLSRSTPSWNRITAARGTSSCWVKTSDAAVEDSGSRPADTSATENQISPEAARDTSASIGDDGEPLLRASNSSPLKLSGSKAKFASSKGSSNFTGPEPFPLNTKVGNLISADAEYSGTLSSQTGDKDCVEGNKSTLSLNKAHSASKNVFQGQKVFESVYCPSSAVLTIAELTNEILTSICYLVVDQQFCKNTATYKRLKEDEEEESSAVSSLHEEVKQKSEQKTAAVSKPRAEWEESQQLWEEVSVDDKLPLIDSQVLQPQSSSEELSSSVLALLNQRFSQTGFSSHSGLCSSPEYIRTQETLCNRDQDNSSVNLKPVAITLKTHSKTNQAEVTDSNSECGLQPQAKGQASLTSEAAQSDVVIKVKASRVFSSVDTYTSSKLSLSTSGDETKDGTDDVKQINATDVAVESGESRFSDQNRISPNEESDIVEKNVDSLNSFCENVESDNDKNVAEDGDDKRADSLEGFSMQQSQKSNTGSLASGLVSSGSVAVESGESRLSDQNKISPNEESDIVEKNVDSLNSFCENVESDNDKNVAEDGDDKRADSLEGFSMQQSQKSDTGSLASGLVSSGSVVSQNASSSEGGAVDCSQETSISKHLIFSLEHSVFHDSTPENDDSFSSTQPTVSEDVKAKETVAKITDSIGQMATTEDLLASACTDSSPVLLPILLHNSDQECLPAADDSLGNSTEIEPGSTQTFKESTSTMESFSIDASKESDKTAPQADTEDEALTQEPHSISQHSVQQLKLEEELKQDREECRTLDSEAVLERNLEECARLHMCDRADGSEEINFKESDASLCELWPNESHLAQQFPDDTATCTSLQGKSTDGQSDMVNKMEIEKAPEGKDLLSVGQKLVDQLCTSGNISGNRNDTPPVDTVPQSVQYNSQPAEGIIATGESPQNADTMGLANTFQAEAEENRQVSLSHHGGYGSESDRTILTASIANGHGSQIEISSESENINFTSESYHLLDLLNIEEESDITRNSRRIKVLFQDDCHEEEGVTGQRKNYHDDMETSHLCAQNSYTPVHPLAALYHTANVPLQLKGERQGLDVRGLKFMGESSTTSPDNQKHVGGSAGSKDIHQNLHTSERVIIFNNGSLGEHDAFQETVSCSVHRSVEAEEELEDEEEEEAEEVVVSGLMDVFQLDQQCSKNKYEVNSALKKLSKKQRKTTILQHYILQQMREKDELSRLIKLSESERGALKEEKSNLNLDLQRTCDIMTVDDEGNAKKHEPLMYKKYCAIKSSMDAKGLLSTIRNRQRALHFLEAMTYRKYVALQHSLKIEVEKAEADEKKKGGKPSANNSDKVSNVPDNPPPPKKPRKVKDVASLCATPTQTQSSTPSARPTNALLPLNPILMPSPSDGSASSGAVVLPGFFHGPLAGQGSGGISVFSWPSAGHLNFDEILETDV